MCDHCGCRTIPAIAELTADHERILTLAWKVAEGFRLGQGAPPAMGKELLALLDVHVVKEESGLYPLLAASGDLAADTLSELEEEHRTLHLALKGGAFDRRDYFALAAHIEAEETDLFPAAMFAFDDETWSELELIHRQAVSMGSAPRDVRHT